jgi:tetratricopeptide (TPR) repeat protein
MIIAVFVIASIAVFFFFFSRSKKSGEKKKRSPRLKDRSKIIRSASRKLSQNPKDTDALIALAELYYEEQDYQNAQKNYFILIGLCASNPDLNEFDFTLKHALSSLKIKNYKEAYRGFAIARSLNEESFEANYNLGYLEYLRKKYERAVSLLRKAQGTHPEHLGTARYLGLSLYRLQRHEDAIKILKNAVAIVPDDNEIQFTLAQCLYEKGNNKEAIRIFNLLRTDSKLGPKASLYAGVLNMANNLYPQAVTDFEIGLHHTDIKKVVSLELKYRLAVAYINQKEISRALELLKEVARENPDYKDVSDLVRKYRELSSNKTFQTYLISPTSEFVILCRNIVSRYFLKGKVKIVDVSMAKNEYVDILAEVDTGKWIDIVLFRFIRNTGSIGELALRELYSRAKDVRAGRALCFTAGEFSDAAGKFVEARLIDLIGKEQLIKLFRRLRVEIPSL